MSKLVTLQIDGKQVQAPEGTLIVDAARLAGIDIPVFCYHPKMEPVGMCRMCLVEIGRPIRDRATGEVLLDPEGAPQLQFGPKLETACTTPISEGMIVLGTSDKARAGREDILEFLLTSHPLDCPVCDKGGECPLQNLTMAHGPGQSRFIYDDKFHLAKRVPLGELIMLDRERCIQCARCTRFQSEVVDDPVIGFFQRGRALEIVTFSEPGFASYFSGNTTDICPVGALTTVDFRFEARPWELNAAASICNHCPVGCNITLNTRREARAGGAQVVKRVMPRQNESVNEIWICDKGRFAYHYTQSPERLTRPLVRKGGELLPATWEEAFQAAADGLRGAGAGLLALGGGRLSNEDHFNLHLLAKSLGGTAVLYSRMAGGELVSQFGLPAGSDFSSMGPGTAILVVACDLEEEAPLWWLRVKQAAGRGASLVVANPRSTKTDRYAAYALRYTYGDEAKTVSSLLEQAAARPGANGAAESRLDAAARLLADAENLVVIYGSEGLGFSGSQALAAACAELLVQTKHTGRPNSGLMAAWDSGNVQGAWELGLLPVENLSAALASAPAAYIAAADPAGDEPLLGQALSSAGFLVVQELFLTETAKLADVVLPAQAFTERGGSYTNGQRRVQRFYPAVPPLAHSLPDYEITAQVGARLGLDLEGRSPLLVMERIAASVPAFAGISYATLAEVTQQWPIVGRGDLYYGGTTYENSQGLGVQLPLLPESRSHAADLSRSHALRGNASPDPIQGENATPGETVPGKLSGLLALPITRLYDRGRTVLPSELLASRIPGPHVLLNPSDAASLKLKAGDRVELLLPGKGALTGPAHGSAAAAARVAAVRLDDSVPTGCVLVPRSMGLLVWEPVPVELRPAPQPETAHSR